MLQAGASQNATLKHEKELDPKTFLVKNEIRNEFLGMIGMHILQWKLNTTFICVRKTLNQVFGHVTRVRATL